MGGGTGGGVSEAASSDGGCSCAGASAADAYESVYNERPQWLADAHANLDAAVALAYGWETDISDDNALNRLLTQNTTRSTFTIKEHSTTHPIARYRHNH